MLSPYAILGLSLLAVLATVILAFAFVPRPAKPEYGRDDSLDDVEPATAGDGYHYRKRLVGKRPELAAPYGRGKYGETLQPKLFLTPRQLERVNIQRKLRNKPPLNRAGFVSAAAHAWDQPRKQPNNSSDWLMYFVMYECFIADHQSHLVAPSGGLTIDPNLPYNGQGGDFAGAGASGDWSRGADPYAALPDAPAGTGGFAPLPPPSDSGSYSPGDTVGGYGSTLDPTPSVSDSSSSYSSSSSDSSSSSSSSDSGSSGGGGGD